MKKANTQIIKAYANSEEGDGGGISGGVGSGVCMDVESSLKHLY